MVEDILKAKAAYQGLSPIGKRLFREETGLNSVKQRTGRRRTATKAKTAARHVTRTDLAGVTRTFDETAG